MGDAQDRRAGLGDRTWGAPPPELIDAGAPWRAAPSPPLPALAPARPAAPAPPVPTSALAVAALAVAALSAAFLLLVPVLNVLGGALGLALGIAARRHIYRAAGRLGGDGPAVGSIVVGGVLVVIGLLEIAVVFGITFLLSR